MRRKDRMITAEEAFSILETDLPLGLAPRSI